MLKSLVREKRKNILKTQKRQSQAIILKRAVTGNIRMVILQMVSHTVDLD